MTTKYAFSTCGRTSVDTRILVSTACGNALTSLACDDDGQSAGLTCSSFSSQTASVDMTAGTTYYVALGGFDVDSYGTGTLRVIQSSPPVPTSVPTLAPTWSPQTIGPTMAALTGYNMVETQPMCYFTLSYPYCPAPGAGQQFSDLYASYQDRLGTALLNAARCVSNGKGRDEAFKPAFSLCAI